VLAKKAQPAKAQAKKAAKESSSEDESSEEEAPVKGKKANGTNGTAKAPAKKAAKDESSDDESSEEESEEEAPKKAPRKQSNVSQRSTRSKKSAKNEDEDEEEEEEKGGDESQKELFVGNISFNTTEDSIRKAFSKFGKVTNLKLPYNPQGQPKGFAFVEFSSHNEAQKALDGQNGKDLDGRALRINFSGGAPGGNGFGDAPRRGGFGGGEGGESTTIFVGNLGFKTTIHSLRDFFSQCGDIKDVRIA